MFELLRKFSLLMLLFVVGMGTYQTMENSTDWRETLWVQVYPIDGDGSDATRRYMDKLDVVTFTEIEEFIRRDADRYNVAIENPVRVVLGNEIDELPPAPPSNGNPFSVGYWSLKLRWWASSVTSDQPGPRPDVRLFLVFHDPEKTPAIAHSLGLQKGLIGIVNVFASESQSATNNFVIAHEMLHTLGATDKYGGQDNLPIYPAGYGDPTKQPLYPQSKAEIMGGRIALSQYQAVIPRSLQEAVVGATTAEEIRWIE